MVKSPDSLRQEKQLQQQPKNHSSSQSNHIETVSQKEPEQNNLDQEINPEREQMMETPPKEESAMEQQLDEQQRQPVEEPVATKDYNRKTKQIAKTKIDHLKRYLQDLKSVIKGQSEGYEDHFERISIHFQVEQSEVFSIFAEINLKSRPIVEKPYLNPDQHKEKVKVFERQIVEITQTHLFSTIKTLCKHLKVYNKEECDPALVKKALDNLNYGKNESGNWVKNSFSKPINTQFSLSSKKLLQEAQRKRKPILSYAEYQISVSSGKPLRIAIVGGPEGTSHRLDKPNAENQFCTINIKTTIIDHAKKYDLNIEDGLVLTIGFEEIFGEELMPNKMTTLESQFECEMETIGCKVIIFPEGMRNLSPFYSLKCELTKVLSDPKNAERSAKLAKCIISKSEAIEEAKTILGINYRQINDAPFIRLR